MALDNPNLKDVLGRIHSGQLQLPDFQRDWKWGDQGIRELIATVTLNYPLGVVMTLRTGGETSFRARPLAGVDGVDDVEPESLLLDGQQRLTSLYQSLYLNKPVETEDARKNPIRVWYYVDIAKAIGPAADRDDAIVSVRDHNRKVRVPYGPDVDLSDTAGEVAAGHFPLHIVFDIERVHDWQRAFTEHDPAHAWPLWTAFETKVLHNIRTFLVPMINLGADTTPDAVCSVFERVNTGGVPLNVFELLTATYAGDRQYEHEHHGNRYDLRKTWAELKSALVLGQAVFGDPDSGVDDGMTSTDLLQAVALVRTWELKQVRPSAAVSCKRRDLLNLPLHDFDRLAPLVRDAFIWVGEFLADQCIVTAADLPYRSQLIPLAAVRTILGDRTDEPGMRERITRWYWCGVLGEMYSGSTETRFARDVEQLVTWTDPSAPTPDTVSESVFARNRLDSLSTRNSAAYKGIVALLVKHEATDWYFTADPLTAATLVQHAVDIRQIFPKKWLQSRNKEWVTPGNSIVNKTPLSERAAKNIVGAPSRYLPVLASESGTLDQWFDDVVATHLIDPALLRNDDFEAFYADRRSQLLALVESAMGQGAFLRDATED
ncbi:DUF262 domain-containing protein [Nocardia sp. NPDC060259]|uniref:GmrSD restriction endonuclease domain-containing protein n=1 Tax=Nocardia sp. NPDC060259 TaxID=3347088 RepID=UPI00366601C7